METFTSHDAKQNFGRLIDKALQEPVSITKHGRPSVVVTSNAEYQELLAIKYGRLKEEVLVGFKQLDEGEFSGRTNDEIANAVLQRYEHG